MRNLYRLSIAFFSFLSSLVVQAAGPSPNTSPHAQTIQQQSLGLVQQASKALAGTLFFPLEQRIMKSLHDCVQVTQIQRIQQYSAIALVSIQHCLRANTLNGFVLVDLVRVYDLEQYPTAKMVQNTKAFTLLRSQHPDVFAMPESVLIKLADHGQRVVFAKRLADCHACETLGVVYFSALLDQRRGRVSGWQIDQLVTTSTWPPAEAHQTPYELPDNAEAN